MAEAKIFLFDSPSKMLKDGTYPVTLKVTHDRKRKYFSLNRRCLLEQWNKEAGRFLRNYPKHVKENEVLLAMEGKASNIIREFERDGVPFTFTAFEKTFLNLEQDATIKGYFQLWIDKFIKEGKIGTASPYKTTLNLLLEFTDDSKAYRNRELRLIDINYKFLIDLEHWLRTDRGVKDSSISVYMRTLRSILNKAIKEKLIKRDYYPFDEYRLSERLKTKTPKRAIPKAAMKEIEALELPDHSPLQFAQHIFLFSYYTRGMNFVDIANLTPENIYDGRINYIRRKTKKPFSIKILPQVEQILEFYQNSKVTQGAFIFPVFDTTIHITPEQRYHRRKTVLREVNRNLKQIAAILGLENLNLTSYVSRHTYATVLKQAGTNIAHISEALGHESEKVTQIYLKQFENSELDELDANLL